MTKDEALRMALKTLEGMYIPNFTMDDSPINNSITAIKEALAQPEQEPVIGTKTWFEDGKVVTQHLTAKDIYKEPEQEPVAWMYPDALCDKACLYLCTKGFTQFPECATPPQRKPLTDEQKSSIVNANCPLWGEIEPYGIIDDVEAAHGIKE